MADSIDTNQIWSLLEDVKDPEIPAVSVLDMGMVRTIGVEADKVIITFTPTFAGCPALHVIREAIEAQLNNRGISNVEIRVSLSPAWSSNWITPVGREKLKNFGLAPPPQHTGDIEKALEQPAICPFCQSPDTEQKNDFGSTLCRAIYVCKRCKQPFEQFKPV